METERNARTVLPASHVFLTVSRGASHRTVMVRTRIAWAAALALPMVLLWLVGSTGYVLFHDTLVRSAMLHERDMQYDYEDRIAALRTELDRATSQAMMTQRTVTSRLDELQAREAELVKRSGTLADLDRATAGAIAAIGIAPPEAAGTKSAVSRPATAPPENAAAGVTRRPEDHADLATELRTVAAAGTAFDAIAAAQDERLLRLDATVASARDHVRSAIEATGLPIERVLRADLPKATGGPFVPLPDGEAQDRFGQAAVRVGQGLSEMERLAAAVSHIPLRKPLHGDPEITSPFGARVDPFLGRPAMHTGLDLREDTGTEVYATAPGRVVSAGPASGYGLMVAIDHGNGLETRYAHLSRIEATVGQALKRGDIVGEVGATGRATGPHLHYETRIDGEAVDPLRFLLAGQKLFGGRDS